MAARRRRDRHRRALRDPRRRRQPERPLPVGRAHRRERPAQPAGRVRLVGRDLAGGDGDAGRVAELDDLAGTVVAPEQVGGRGEVLELARGADRARDMLGQVRLEGGIVVLAVALFSLLPGAASALCVEAGKPVPDVTLPGIDGLEVCKILRRDASTASIPVIMLTIVDDRNLGYSLGASEFMTKPIDRDRLLAGRQVGGVRGERPAEPGVVERLAGLRGVAEDEADQVLGHRPALEDLRAESSCPGAHRGHSRQCRTAGDARSPPRTGPGWTPCHMSVRPTPPTRTLLP